MKAKHLLAALALPAIFTACSQDELPTNNVEKEVVGTPIGYDLEFKASFNNGPSTRLTPEIGWEVGDKIGMGWISATGLAASANLYSNHPIFCKDGAGKFKSETMIYEGLYIVSYPFQLTQKVAPLAFDLSKQNSDSSYYSGRQHVSDKFITLTEKTAGLGNATTLNLVALTNLMKLNIKLPAKAAVPEDFKITGVTLTDTSNKLVNKLTLASTDGAVAATNSTLATACWTPVQGNIEVNFGKDSEGKAIDATKGLDVFVQMGAFATDDATILVLHTNYGDAEITTGTDVVSWSSPVLEVEEAKGDDFASAIQALYTGANAKTKPYGQTVLVNVILDTNKIKVPETVTSQADLDRIIDLLDKLGKLKEGNKTTATIEFSKSTLKVADGVEAAGDVILTDLSGLNKLGGAITFQKSGKTVGTPGVSQTPNNVYLSGELALKADPTFATATAGIAALAEFKVRKGETLTVSEDLDLGAVNLTVNAGATLINKADIAAGVVKTIAGTTKPVVKAGLYISEEGASAANISIFTNGGAVEWIAGTLPTTMSGTLYANVALSTDMKSASDAFELVTGGTPSNEIIIATDMTTPTQLTKTTLGGIKKMTINGNVSFGVGMADAFEFSALTAIDVKSGSFNITGGNPSTAADAFYAFTAGNCKVTLATGTELNVASGAKLALGSGDISYTGATINNSGYIVATGGVSGTGTWNGNAIGVNPKPVKP